MLGNVQLTGSHVWFGLVKYNAFTRVSTLKRFDLRIAVLVAQTFIKYVAVRRFFFWVCVMRYYISIISMVFSSANPKTVTNRNWECFLDWMELLCIIILKGFQSQWFLWCFNHTYNLYINIYNQYLERYSKWQWLFYFHKSNHTYSIKLTVCVLVSKRVKQQLPEPC